MNENRVFADGREWVVQWETGYWNTGGCDFPVIEVVSIHSTDDDSFEIVADVTDEIDGTKLSNQIYKALELALALERANER
jgi:hypothetical protein